MKKITFFISIIFSSIVFSQPGIQWQKCLGGTDTDKAYAVQQTTDGGFITVGHSYSNDGNVSGHHATAITADCWIAKITSVGTLQWQKSLGGIADDKAYAVRQTTDGGYIMAGETYSHEGDVSGNHDTTWSSSDYWIVKLDSMGAVQWQKCLGGTSLDYAECIVLTTDGGYMVAGSSSSSDG
ncbi:MAG TPA: T9SS C-terminal target domain-containing protein, partial [Bacteroidia bacterium]|nr:T9SS C-terminal target domain-containing protein [Bacteroidia bacterium]